MGLIVLFFVLLFFFNVLLGVCCTYIRVHYISNHHNTASHKDRTMTLMGIVNEIDL